MELILASQSPRRRELLTRMGLTGFTALSPDIDEHVFDGLPPAALVETLSAAKAAAILPQAPQGAVIIAADTVVALDDAILGKPIDETDAISMLSALSGKVHQVYTGVTVMRGSEKITEHEVTEVHFRVLSTDEITYYVKTGEPMDKAGAYGIQGLGALLVTGVTGDYYNVMGLPVCRLGRILARFGVDCLEGAIP